MSWLKQNVSTQEQQAGPAAAAVPVVPVREKTPPPPDHHTSQAPTPDNALLFQAFEWHTTSSPPPPHETFSSNSHWSRLARLLPKLHELGITSIWLPPGCKANSPTGNGYDCYDLWDLGEFDQKWTRSTKWGSREELDTLVRTAHQLGVECIWDAVLNHKTAGDAVEETWAVEVDPNDRRVETCAPKKIEAWLRYDFPGRERESMKYSAMKWNSTHFSGTDWDQRRQKNAIFKLIDDPKMYPRSNEEELPIPQNGTSGLNRIARFVKNVMQEKRRRPGKGWVPDVAQDLGNSDYLLFSNIYYLHPEVRQDIWNWGKWMIEHVGINGFRLDAAQHFSWDFTRQWIAAIHTTSRQKHGRDALIIGEVLTSQVSKILAWLDHVTPPESCNHRIAYAFDAPLLYSFSRLSIDVSRGSRNADLRTLLSGPGGIDNRDKKALVALRPHQAITFVTSHDTQAGQSSHVSMEQDLKALFYAWILLRREGLPYVFWGDLYGIAGDKDKGAKAELPACRPILEGGKGYGRSVLPALMLARKGFAYGQQTDYFDSASCVGWVRHGTWDRMGCVVIMSIGKADQWTIKRMVVGKEKAGTRYVDVLAESEEGRAECVIDEEGCGVFACRERTGSVYVREEDAKTVGMDAGLGEFDHDVYRQ